jgi:hypothetical protein
MMQEYNITANIVQCSAVINADKLSRTIPVYFLLQFIALLFYLTKNNYQLNKENGEDGIQIWNDVAEF